ncbi:unnamed protein product [Haemonchus placei]|uniref:LIM zinc-binding domain-containing protein n=1 Tax=Haemonchus placei TaxID=6290 RepID=A0A0N4VV64_HAEPC|nr:unnamed protein product [Haemonchus placei]
MSVSVSFYPPCLIDIQTLQASYEDEEDAYHARPDPYHETAAHPYDNDYVAEPYDRKVPSHDYEYSTYDTAGSHDRGLPSGNHKMSFDDQHYANEYGKGFSTIQCLGRGQ